MNYMPFRSLVKHKNKLQLCLSKKKKTYVSFLILKYISHLLFYYLYKTHTKMKRNFQTFSSYYDKKQEKQLK